MSVPLAQNGSPLISFGKHKGLSALEVMQKDPTYPSWVIKTNKDPNVAADSFFKSKTFSNLASWYEKNGVGQQTVTLPGVFLPYKSNGTRYTLQEVSSILSDGDFDAEEDADFYDKSGEQWAAWKVKSLATKLRSLGHVDN